jgi:hypothetical protein
MASVMDNCAILMVSFSGIYTNGIHQGLFGAAQSERRLVFITRLAGLIFGAVCIALAYAFADVPSAMRFLWKTVSPMGIAFFLGICWRRANRYGALASVVCALLAVLVGEYGFGWKGDAGLPKTITLFLIVGQEDVLRRAGLIETAGTGTFALPPETDAAPSADPDPAAALDLRQSRRESVGGFIILTLIVLLLLGGVILLSRWLGGY